MVELGSKCCQGRGGCMSCILIAINQQWVSIFNGGGLSQTPCPFVLDAFPSAALLHVVAQPLDSEEAVTADMQVRLVGGIGQTHIFAKCNVGFVSWLGGLTEGGSISLSFVTCSWLSGRIRRGWGGLCGWQNPMPDQDSSQLQFCGFVFSCGLALLQMLQPSHVVGP